MIARWFEISPALLSRVRADSSLLDALVTRTLADRLLGSDAPPGLLAALEAGMPEQASKLPPEHRAAFLERVAAMQAAVRAPAAPKLEGAGTVLDLEKAWHGLHFVLTGSAEPTSGPLSDAVFGGADVGPDRGYGPARVLTPTQVQAVANALAALNPAEAVQRLDTSAMEAASVYPGGWDDPKAAEWLIDALSQLRDFYVGAAERGAAVVLTIT